MELKLSDFKHVNIQDFMRYEDREKLKTIGWDLYCSTDDPKKKSWMLMGYIVAAHYWRAREALEDRKDYKRCLKKIRGKNYYKGYVLDIDHYSENWIYSHRNRFDGEIMKNLCEYYTPKSSKYLPDGCSIYQV